MADTDGFDQAVEWLLNSRHTADLEIQDTFWAIAEGTIDRSDADTLDIAEIRARRAADPNSSGAC